MIKVVAYARVSLDKSGQAASVTAQLEEMRAYAAEEGIEILAECRDDSISAYSGAARPGYEEMLGWVRSGRVGGVLVWHPDRAWRGRIAEVEAFIDLAKQHNVRHLHSVMGGRTNLNSALGVKSLTNAAVDARYESAHRGERVKMARRRQAEQGVHGGGSRRPYGYGVEVMERPIFDRATRTYVVTPLGVPWLDMTRANPVEAAEIRSWAKQFLAGVSMRQVLASLAERKVPTSTGGKWSGRTIRQILENPRISGHAVRGGEVVRSDAWEAILDEGTRLALVALFKDPARRTAPGNTPKWLGSMLFRCGVCNDGTVVSVRGRNGRPVYCCRTYQHAHRPAELVDAYVADTIIARLSLPDAVTLLPRPADNGPDPAKLHGELVVIEERLNEVSDAFGDGAMTRAQFERQNTRLLAQQDEIRSRLAAVQTVSPLAGVVGAADVRQVWESRSLGQRRAILRELCTVTVMPPGRGRRGGFDPLEAVVIEPRQAS